MQYLKKQFLSMRIKFQEEFLFELNNQIHYISKDKPVAARKFKSDLLRNINKDLKNPLQFKKSIYYNDENIRDYVFKAYKVVIKVDIELETVSVVAILKHKNSL